MHFFIGYDNREDEVYRVAVYSLLSRTPQAEVVPLVQDHLRAWDMYWRPRDERAATDFSLTRFLVPQIHKEGWAVFADCDFLFTRNIVAALRTVGLDERYAAYVVKHPEYKPAPSKMDGKENFAYPRKNWSSFIVWNCEHEANKSLTPSVVSSAAPSWLHQFSWLDNSEIGALPSEFNHLVGEDAEGRDWDEPLPTRETPACLHFTLGIGAFTPPVPFYHRMWEAERRTLLEKEKREGALHVQRTGWH
jgi:hypothetical protein